MEKLFVLFVLFLALILTACEEDCEAIAWPNTKPIATTFTSVADAGFDEGAFYGGDGSWIKVGSNAPFIGFKVEGTNLTIGIVPALAYQSTLTGTSPGGPTNWEMAESKNGASFLTGWTPDTVVIKLPTTGSPHVIPQTNIIVKVFIMNQAIATHAEAFSFLGNSVVEATFTSNGLFTVTVPRIDVTNHSGWGDDSWLNGKLILTKDFIAYSFTNFENYYWLCGGNANIGIATNNITGW